MPIKEGETHLVILVGRILHICRDLILLTHSHMRRLGHEDGMKCYVFDFTSVDRQTSLAAIGLFPLIRFFIIYTVKIGMLITPVGHYTFLVIKREVLISGCSARGV